MALGLFIPYNSCGNMSVCLERIRAYHFKSTAWSRPFLFLKKWGLYWWENWVTILERLLKNINFYQQTLLTINLKPIFFSDTITNDFLVIKVHKSKKKEMVDKILLLNGSRNSYEIFLKHQICYIRSFSLALTKKMTNWVFN